MEKNERITFVTISDRKIACYIDLTNNGLRTFCITCEIILLAGFVSLVICTPYSGRSLILLIGLLLSIPTPLSVLLVYGTIASLRKKEIIVDRSANMVALIERYATMSRKRIIPFENIDAILLESVSTTAPPYIIVDPIDFATQQYSVELVFIFADGKRARIVKGSFSWRKEILLSDVQRLQNKLVSEILLDKEKPVVFLSERIKILKLPFIDGETVLEISKDRNIDKFEPMAFGIVLIMSFILISSVAYFIDIEVFAWIGIGLSLMGCGPFVFVAGIRYSNGKISRDCIIVNENAGNLIINNVLGRKKITLDVNNIAKICLDTKRIVTRGSVGPIITFSYLLTSSMKDKRNILLIKSDRFLEARCLNNLLEILIDHARLKQQDSNTPPLPLLTYDAMYKKKETEETKPFKKLAEYTSKYIFYHDPTIRQSSCAFCGALMKGIKCSCCGAILCSNCQTWNPAGYHRCSYCSSMI